MRFALAVLLFCGCATAQHAETFKKKGFAFSGPRVLAFDETDGDAEAFERALLQFGFTVSEDARYIAKIDGTCLRARLSDVNPEPLRVDVFRASNHERVFAATLDETGDCPNAFFVETAAALARNWPER